ncbi:hypothetical protein C8Q76DRAFT_803173 [Earliella scabrosa]|nr:hypothetical protein C8Q76DRAFT_803173 [Earliella scabrosa]
MSFAVARAPRDVLPYCAATHPSAVFVRSLTPPDVHTLLSTIQRGPLSQFTFGPVGVTTSHSLFFPVARFPSSTPPRALRLAPSHTVMSAVEACKLPQFLYTRTVSISIDLRMSGMSDAEWAASLANASMVQFYLPLSYRTLATICLLYYDYFLTLGDEVRLVWCRRLNLASVLYLAIRYTFLVLLTLTLFVTLPLSPTWVETLPRSRCQSLSNAYIVVQLVAFAAVSAFAALRIMALWSRNWVIGVFLFVLGLLNPTGIQQARLSTYLDFTHLTVARMVTFPLAFSVLSIAYEVLCLLLTVGKTLSSYRLGRQAGIKTPLSSMLLRDGSLYFLVVTLLALLDIIAALDRDGKVPGGVISTFSRVLTPVLATRFLAHLRDVDRDQRMSSLGVSQLPSMQINPPTVIRGRGLSSVSGVLDFGDMDDLTEERVGAEVGDE